jgi:hypothetical protein
MEPLTTRAAEEETQMVDPPRHPDPGEDGGMPRWVKVLGIVVAVVVLLVVATMLVGGGGHRPRRHGGAGSDAPSVSVARSGGSPSWAT